MAKVFSIEDANLKKQARVTRERTYADLDLTLAARTSNDGDVFRKLDAGAVKQSIKTLLLTNRYEKPFRPNFGANLGGLLFELADEDTGDEIIENITKSVERYEPRAKILDLKVSATPDYNSVSVTIQFRVVNTDVVDVLKVKLGDFVGRTAIPVVAPPKSPDPDPVNVLLQEGGDRLQVDPNGDFLSFDVSARD